MKCRPAVALGALSLVLALACGTSDGARATPREAAPPAAAPALPAEPASPPAPGAASGIGSEPGAEGAAAEAAPVSGAEELAPGEVPLAGGGSGGSGAATASQGPAAGAAGEPGADPEPPSALAPLTIWLAGDSTVANGNTPCPRGWGGAFAPLFNELVTVNNAAAGGRSVHTWLYEVQAVMEESGECALNRDASGEPVLQPRWRAMLDGMQPGDYLFIQFGINDGSPTCDRHVGLEAFEAAYGMMAQAAEERGAHTIFVTPVSSIACSGATARGSRGEYVDVTLAAGEAYDVPVIDLHERSVALFQSLAFCPVPGGDVSAQTTGPVGDFFCDDHTHFSGAGAARIAEVVARALVDQGIPLAAYLR